MTDSTSTNRTTESGPSLSSHEPSYQTNRIFLSNLANELEEFTIYKYCSAYGEITKCQIMKESKTGDARGFGFITYVLASSAHALLNAQPHYIGHHKINVQSAFPTSEILVSSAMSAAISQSRTSTSNSQTPQTRRLFVAYNIPEASRNNLTEPAIFGYLSTFGVVKEILQQFSRSQQMVSNEKPKQKNPSNEYWIVEFMAEESVEKCMAKGALHFIQGVRVHMKKMISKQDQMRQRRQLQEEEAARAERAAAVTNQQMAVQHQQRVVMANVNPNFYAAHQPFNPPPPSTRHFFPPPPIPAHAHQRAPATSSTRPFSSYSSGGSLLPPPPPPATAQIQKSPPPASENPFRTKVDRQPQTVGANSSKRTGAMALLDGYGYKQQQKQQETGGGGAEMMPPSKQYKYLQF